MRWVKGKKSIVLATLVVLGITSFMFFATSKDREVGLVNGALRPCPNSPNCVSSESREDSSKCEPLHFQGSADDAMAKLKTVVQELGGLIKQDQGGYLWAVFTSRIFRFKDDVEFRLVEEENLIHVRSASRVGYSDLGVNRSRINRLRAAFQGID